MHTLAGYRPLSFAALSFPPTGNMKIRINKFTRTKLQHFGICQLEFRVRICIHVRVCMCEDITAGVCVCICVQ